MRRKEAGGRLVLWDDAGDPPPQEWRERATITISTPDPAVDVRHFRAIAPFMRERWRGRFEIELPVELPDGPHLAAAAHVPRAVSSGRCNRNHCARGAGLRDATGDGHGDCLSCSAAPTAPTCSCSTVSVETRSRWPRHSGATIDEAPRSDTPDAVLVEARHDLSRSADAVTRALGWVGPVGRVTAHLGDLPTPPLSRPITRAEARVGGTQSPSERGMSNADPDLTPEHVADLRAALGQPPLPPPAEPAATPFGAGEERDRGGRRPDRAASARGDRGAGERACRGAGRDADDRQGAGARRPRRVAATAGDAAGAVDPRARHPRLEHRALCVRGRRAPRDPRAGCAARAAEGPADGVRADARRPRSRDRPGRGHRRGTASLRRAARPDPAPRPRGP